MLGSCRVILEDDFHTARPNNASPIGRDNNHQSGVGPKVNKWTSKSIPNEGAKWHFYLKWLLKFVKYALEKPKKKKR
jgi:hypothetical protein